MKKIILLLCCSVIYYNLHAQGEIDDQEKALFFNETSFGISLTSSGYGLDYRFAKNINYFRKTLYTVDFSEIRHPKENKVLGQSYGVNRNFVYGKLNHFYQLRLGYGKQREIYSKRDKGSISIRYIYTGGLDIGILKPVYYEYYVSQPEETRFYDTFIPHANIVTRANYFKGFSEISVVPGLFVKGGFTFEYGSNTFKIQALETGATFDVFYKGIPQVYDSKKNFMFLTLYINYRIGFVRQQYQEQEQSAIDILFGE